MSSLFSPWGNIRSPKTDISEYGKTHYPLTLGQKIAAEQIIQWLNDPDEEEYLLRGFAGTGKTTVAQLICAYLKCVAPELRIGQCAYSHQAKKVLRKTSVEAGLDIPAMTCCQMLEARPNIDYNSGALVFEPETEANMTIRNFDLVIIDEAYGLDSTDLALFRRAIKGTDIKLLYLGDSAQTGPIGELHSPVATIKGYELTEVVRYGGPILEFATKLRTDLTILHDLPESACCEQKLTGLWNMDPFVWSKTLNNAFKNFYDLDPYHRRAICFTNKRVAEINAAAREVIYGRRELGQFMIGERITFKDPYEQRFYTSDEATVLGWEEKSIYVDDLCEYVNILYTEIESEGCLARIPVVKLSETRLTKALKDLASRNSWKIYHKVKAQFAWVDYAYALTIHKAKGSTFGDIFADVGDMRTCLRHKYKEDPNGHIVQFNRLLYTASTRPTHRLFLGN